MPTLATLIKQTREQKNWTQDELAERLGVSRGYIGQLETGLVKRPRPQMLEQFERVLGVSREDMLRAAGMLGPAEDIDLLSELRRIAAMPNIEDRVQALQQLPPEAVQAIEDLAVDLIRQVVPRSREQA